MFRHFVRLLAAVFLATALPASAETRMALVIGNGAYDFAPLANPAGDARLMAQSLGATGFRVTTLTDAGREEMKRAIRSFAEDLRGAGPDAVALFFFAGHGVQVKGRNYLIPIDAQIGGEADMDYETVEAQWVLDLIGEARTGLSIVVLDACRNNPFPAVSRAASRGLARMDAPTGSILAFSTAPGQVALDGTGSNSPYTAALAEAIRQPGVKIEEAFKQVRRSVVEATGREQVPWESSSLIGDFYFAGSAGAPAASTRPLAAAKAPGAVFSDCPGCPEMVALPGGSFTMGSASETPQTQVSVPAFAIGRTEVTRGQYAAFAAETGRGMADGCWYLWLVWLHDGARNWREPGFAQDDDHPIVCMRWSDAQAYADWLSRRTGQRYRLPTEAEWEYAAGDGRGSAPWGGNADMACGNANVYDQTARDTWGSPPVATVACDDGYAETAPVGHYGANGFGLHDMIGNGWEWTEDCWNASHAGRPASAAAVRSGDCNKRVYKGGNFISPATDLRPSIRAEGVAEWPNVYGTFRLVRELQ